MDRIPTTTFTELVSAAAAVAGQTDLQAVLRTTVSTARDLTGARYAAMGVLGEHGTLIDFIYVGMTAREAEGVGRLPVGKGVLGSLVTDPKPIRLEDIREHPDSVGFPEHHPEMHAFLGVPVRVREQVFGNLYLTEKDGGFTEGDELVVEALAAVAGSAVSAARLNERLRRAALVEDRERIARDLHDAVIQDLFAVGLGLQGLSMSIEDRAAAEKLDDAIDRIDQAIGSLRTFIFDLRSLASAKSDPGRAFRRMAERIAAPHGIDVAVQVDELGPVAADRLDDALLIVREAVSNAVRHGSPATITVGVRRAEEWLEVSVGDDGTGFDPARSPRGMGLDNLEARATRNGGELQLESSPGVGTSVIARLPV